MERQVRLRFLEVVVAPDRVGQRIETRAERIERRSIHSRRGLNECALFKEHPQLHTLADFLRGQARHLGADIRRAHDEAEPFQLAERLPDGCLADPKVERQVKLAQRLARCEPAGKDRSPKGCDDLSAERLGLKRLGTDMSRHRDRVAPVIVIVIDNLRESRRIAFVGGRPRQISDGMAVA